MSGEPTPHNATGWSRRTFVRAMVGGGVVGAGALSFFEFARSKATQPPQGAGPGLAASTRAVLAAVQALILPSEPAAPGATEVGAIDYLEGALRDPRTDADDKKTVEDGVARLIAAAKQQHRADFDALPSQTQSKLVQQMSSDEDGAEWLSVMVVFTLEALLSDPVYGGNKDQAGWRWLGISPAQPRPSAPWQVALKGKEA